MKRFREFSEQETLNESRLLRKGVATVFAMKVRNEGKRLVRSAASAKTALRHRPSDTAEEQLRRVQDGLSELADVTVSQRRMLGHLTSIVVSGQLFNERTNRQLEKLLKNRP